MPYLTANSINTAISELHRDGSAHHLLKIWFVLKQMGLSSRRSLKIDTSNSQPALERLFGCGLPSGEFFVPFAHVRRFMTMKSDAARAIIQTIINRWAASDSVVTVKPNMLFNFQKTADDLVVSVTKSYPKGLGVGRDGFALPPFQRVSLPHVPFAVWYYRSVQLELKDLSGVALRDRLQQDLSLTDAEFEAVFGAETDLQPELQTEPLTEGQLARLVRRVLSGAADERSTQSSAYFKKVTENLEVPTGPEWLSSPPALRLEAALQGGSTACLLYGPPRTGKTRAIDMVVPRGSGDRETIQIHDGWGYDDLVTALRPSGSGQWSWQAGPLLRAIQQKRKYIVLEEINRTAFTQAIGEVFSLLESTYRGEHNAVRLRSDEKLWIPDSVIFLCTMNTLDRSTEELDDAVLGRFTAIEFPPRLDNLVSLLDAAHVREEIAAGLCKVFLAVNEIYPLGHGYFSDFRADSDAIDYYLARIRPVLQVQLRGLRDPELQGIDSLVDDIFG